MDIKTLLISLAVIGATVAAVTKFLVREYQDVRKTIDEAQNCRREKAP